MISDSAGALIDINAGQTSRNGLIPSAVVARRIVDGLAYILQRQQRMVWWAAQGLDTGVGIYASTAQKDDQWAHGIRTGYGCTKLIYYVVTFLPAGTPGGTPQLQIREAGGSINSDIVYRSDSAIVTTVGLGLTVTHRIEVSGLTENTEYQFTIRTDNNMRICGACAFEEKRLGAINDSSIMSGYNRNAYSTGSPIYDNDWALISNMAHGLWKKNAACVFSYSRIGDNATYDGLSTNNTSFENLFDPGVTTFSATDIGFTVNTQYLGLGEGGTNTVTVQPKLYVRAYAKLSSAVGSGKVRIRDTSGTVASSAFISSASWAWYSFNGDLTDQSGGHHLGIFGYHNTGGASLEVAAIQCWIEQA